MEDVFKPDSLSIKNLFGSPDSLFEVPMYQRPYSWESEEVEQLWNDLYEAYTEQEKNQNYFLGSIITIPKDRGYQDIVDGQQRLTTLMILFCVIRDLYPNINQNIDIKKNSKVIKIKRIKGFISDEDDRTRLKLLTHASHQNDFEECVLKEGATNATQPKNNKDSVKDKFIQVSDIFREKLSEIGEEETGRLLNYIGNHVKMIKITCRERSFAVKLFQVLNNRGKDLEASDLIKSALISKLPDSKHKQFIADWDKVNNIIKNFECGTGIDDMFTLYVYYNLASNPKRNNYEEVENFSKNRDSNEVINDFKNFCFLYGEQISNSNNKIINSFWYLRWKYHWKAILVTALKSNFSEYKELTFELRRFYYLNWIAGKTVNTIKQTSFNLIKFVKEGQSLSFIREELNKKLEADNIFQLALSNLKSNSAKASWIKPVLMMIEYHQTDEEDKDFISLYRKVHLEHILPVQYKKISGWEHIEENTADNYLNSIGNLTLLGGSKNVEASNNSLKIKLNIYKGKGKHNKSKKGVTSFLITQKIAQDVNAGNIEKWDKNAMENRWNWFLYELKDLLQIDISSILINEKNKIEDIKNKTLIKPEKKVEKINEVNPAFLQEFKVSWDLQQVIRISTATRPQAIKKIWEYIRDHKLQDEENRRQINVDGTPLGKLFPGKKSLSMFELPKMVDNHLEPHGETKQQERKQKDKKQEKKQKNKKEEKKQKNKEFFNQFLDEMKEGHPDFYLRHSVNNAIHATPSKSFSRITVFRAVDNPRVGIFWIARKNEDHQLFELMKKDANFPKTFNMEEEVISWPDDGDFIHRIFGVYLYFNDIYDPSTYTKQMEFLKTNLILIYNFMSRKILEFETNPKAS